MGFPRILSKNNKVYTKLGEFCLSSDASFWIVCQVCQEELQTQDQFWKHIQDEHNFMHGIGIKQQDTATRSFLTEAAEAHLMPLPLYRKLNEGEQRAAALEHGGGDSSQEQHETKDYTEMRVIEPNAVAIDIKIEPPSQALPLPPPASATQSGNMSQQQQQQQQQQLQHQHQQQQAIDVSAGAVAPTLYQLPQVPSAYAAIVHTAAPTLPSTLGMPAGLTAQQAAAAAAAAAAGGTAAAAVLMSQEMPKESNSTTASASSAMSSDDGERWYVCDFETCGLKFKYQSRLELHRCVHSKERRFACEICGASFKQSCNLSTHRKKKHFLKGAKGMVQRF